MANPSTLSQPDRSDLQSRPSYAHIVDDILQDINDGRLRPGDRLASEVQLRKQYGIGISTIKRGLDELARRGVLVRRRGSGTYVSRRPERPAPAVSRDTVALIRAWEWHAYHPFYSEVESGIRSQLAQRGWQDLDVFCGDRPEPKQDVDVRYLFTNTGQVRSHLLSHPETLGIISLQGSSEIAADLDSDLGLPTVCTGPTVGLPWVGYDWDAERLELLRLALRPEVRRLTVVSCQQREDVEAALAHACTAAGRERASVDLTICDYPASKNRSELITRAYQGMSEQLGASDRAAADAIVVTSEFEAQGVADALGRYGDDAWRAAAFYTQISKASQMHVGFPWTALVADGEAMGRALVDMLHAQVTRPASAPSSHMLRCQLMTWGR